MATKPATTVTYTSAQSRIELDATGVHLRKGSTVNGRVVINVTDGQVRSVGVYARSNGATIVKFDPDAIKVADLAFASKRDAVTLAAFLR